MAQVPRPERVTREHIKLGKTDKVGSIKARLSAKIVDDFRNNQNAPACCRDVDSNDIEFFDTDGNGVPDKITMTCDVCGRKHIRVAMGGSKPVSVAQLDQ